MCDRCHDYRRTARLLLDLAQYVKRPGADARFAHTVAYALAASLPRTTNTTRKR
ncbi:hypothetical protein [Streptomyces cacaoi]|uniref:Uncharacterized protein n=1 Tax=Streptomyces cacaoi TaxID=1898 RepID=A0A4Y3R5A2_STRCI|nr:hypothetical protein [Streptomyces cacaoi]NNG84597.1 hypothetical protein [Streptomyces cacaoi]GEB51943.1 hypothetical protein SCA03_44940 [Streptomyces cacaoi]